MKGFGWECSGECEAVGRAVRLDGEGLEVWKVDGVVRLVSTRRSTKLFHINNVIQQNSMRYI